MTKGFWVDFIKAVLIPLGHGLSAWLFGYLLALGWRPEHALKIAGSLGLPFYFIAFTIWLWRESKHEVLEMAEEAALTAREFARSKQYSVNADLYPKPLPTGSGLLVDEYRFEVYPGKWIRLPAFFTEVHLTKLISVLETGERPTARNMAPHFSKGADGQLAQLRDWAMDERINKTGVFAWWTQPNSKTWDFTRHGRKRLLNILYGHGDISTEKQST